MAPRESVPPRPLAPGDVVATSSDLLGAWVAAQVTDLDATGRKVGVLDLDWSGPQPPSIDDLRSAAPLRLTHHAYRSKLSHVNVPWCLPRSYRVVGSMPLVHPGRSRASTRRWGVGDQLAYQRWWDAGEHERFDAVRPVTVTADEVATHATDGAVTRLNVGGIDTLDCARLVEAFPAVRELALFGEVGALRNAAALNGLVALRGLYVNGLFGMTADEVLQPSQVRELESLELYSVPLEYAAATRRLWRPQAAHGTDLAIWGARKPEWVAENLTNPLRGWDGRAHISTATFRRSVEQYRATRRELLAAVRDLSGADLDHALERIAREYGEAFNRLSARNHFIETDEREVLALALAGIVDEAAVAAGRDLAAERARVVGALDAVRDW